MARISRKRHRDDQASPGRSKRQRTDDGDVESSNNAERTRDDLVDDDQLENIKLPDSNSPAPEPLPTGKSKIGPVSGNPIESASGSGAGDGSEHGSKDGSKDGEEASGDRPVAPRRPGRQAVLVRIQEATARLNGLTDNHRPCDCPPTCPGAVHRAQNKHRKLDNREERTRTPSPSDASDPPPLEPTPPEGFMDDTRIRSTVLVRAEDSKLIDLPRFGPEGAQGRLRMSLEVHDDPYGYRSRLGYYGRLYMTPTTDNQERAVGYVSGWRILKPNGRNPQLDPQIWTDEWLRGELPDGDTPEIIDTNGLRDSLRRLYDVNGQPRPNSQYLTANRLELGDNGNEIIYISMIWIYHEYARHGLFKHAMDLFYNLCTNGTLPQQYNINGPVTVLLSPGIPAQDNMAAVWFRAYPQQEGESDRRHLARLQRTLDAFYRRHGYTDYDTTPKNNVIMGRVIMPPQRDLNDPLPPT